MILERDSNRICISRKMWENTEGWSQYKAGLRLRSIAFMKQKQPARASSVQTAEPTFACHRLLRAASQTFFLPGSAHSFARPSRGRPSKADSHRASKTILVKSQDHNLGIAVNAIRFSRHIWPRQGKPIILCEFCAFLWCSFLLFPSQGPSGSEFCVSVYFPFVAFPRWRRCLCAFLLKPLHSWSLMSVSCIFSNLSACIYVRGLRLVTLCIPVWSFLFVLKTFYELFGVFSVVALVCGVEECWNFVVYCVFCGFCVFSFYCDFSMIFMCVSTLVWCIYLASMCLQIFNVVV